MGPFGYTVKKGKVTGLGLSRSKLTTIPVCLNKFAYLENLNLCNNPFEILPEWIGQLTNLKKLDIRLNLIKFLPESIGELKSLEIMYLESTNLETLPESIANLSKLEELSLQENYKLISIPSNVIAKIYAIRNWEWSEQGETDLKKIQELSIQIYEQIPQVEGLEDDDGFWYKDDDRFGYQVKEGKIVALGLPDMDFFALPEIISKLTHLQKLNLNSNALTYLPKWFLKLTNLEKLYLNGNRFETLPECILNLNCLERLDMRYNILVSLPEIEKKFKEQGCRVIF